MVGYVATEFADHMVELRGSLSVFIQYETVMFPSPDPPLENSMLGKSVVETLRTTASAAQSPALPMTPPPTAVTTPAFVPALPLGAVLTSGEPLTSNS